MSIDNLKGYFEEHDDKNNILGRVKDKNNIVGKDEKIKYLIKYTKCIYICIQKYLKK